MEPRRRLLAARLTLAAVAPACAGEPAPSAPEQPPPVVLIRAPVAAAAPAAAAEGSAAPDATTPAPTPSPSVRLERWRTAVEDYRPSVQPGNVTTLGAARTPFATYLNAVHNRIHPVFTDQFLATLRSLPPDHPLNQDLHTSLEITLAKDTGGVVRLGVIKTSGVTAFDVAVLDAVYRAGPFGKAPDAIVSPDGKVYLHWEFHRDPLDACTTRNARPYMLKDPP